MALYFSCSKSPIHPLSHQANPVCAAPVEEKQTPRSAKRKAQSHLTLSIIEGGNETVGKAGARRGVPAGRGVLLFAAVVSAAEALLLSPR